ncbi:unnamed protein product, partial [Durusdinium trenchii]
EKIAATLKELREERDTVVERVARAALGLLAFVGLAAGARHWWAASDGAIPLLSLTYVETFGSRAPDGEPLAIIRLGVDEINAIPLAVLPLIVLTAVVTSRNVVAARRAGDVCAWCLALCFGSVALLAQDVVSFLVGTMGTGLVLTWILGRSGLPAARKIALQYASFQAAGVGLVAMAASALVACQSLMHGAPRSAPGGAALSFHALSAGLAEIAATHPVAAQIESQLVPIALLPLLLGTALLGAIFPLQGWFGGIYVSAPTSVRVWLSLVTSAISGSLWIRLVLPLADRAWGGWPQWGIPWLCCGLLLVALTSANANSAGRVLAGAVLFVNHLLLLAIMVEPAGALTSLWMSAWLPMGAAIGCGLASADRLATSTSSEPGGDGRSSPGSLWLLFVSGTACLVPASVALLTRSMVVRLILGGMLGSGLLLLLAIMVWTFVVVWWVWQIRGRPERAEATEPFRRTGEWDRWGSA